MSPARPPRDLRGLVGATLCLTCADGAVPAIERLCFGAHWAVAVLSDGRAGRAFTFNGQHAVYGALDAARMAGMRALVGLRADAAMARLLDEADAAMAADGAAASLGRSVALAVANALSCRMNAPWALSARGFGISDAADRSFLRPGDAVVLVGAGMLLQDSARACASVDVVDMRPRAALQSVLVEAGGVRTGPGAVRFHGAPDTEYLVARADVVGITGCALENGSLFDIARLPRRARELVVFGPSAQAPMELFAALGATRVAANRIVDAEGLVKGMMERFGATAPPGATEGYLVTMPGAGGARGKERGTP